MLWLGSGFGAAGAVVVFLAFWVVVAGAALDVDAWAFLRHALRAEALFWVWQEEVEALALGVGVADGSAWANAGTVNETAARAARPAIKRRMNFAPGPLAEGDGTASILGVKFYDFLTIYVKLLIDHWSCKERLSCKPS